MNDQLLTSEVFNRAFQRWRSEVTCRPTIGEYCVYDDHLYRWMLEDYERIEAYRGAIKSAACGKRVVDLGTGATAPLAIMCARAGATHVDAIEALPTSAEAARTVVANLRLSDRVTIHCGTSTNVQLPELADLCISEIIGAIGSSEGVVAALQDARRFLKPDGHMLPQRCVTWFAPATAVVSPYSDADCVSVAEYYISRIRHAVKGKVDFSRIITFNFPDDHLLAEKQVFEELIFDVEPIMQDIKAATFTTVNSGRLDGFVLWIELHVDEMHVINSWRGSSWAPVFISTQPVSVMPGDVIQVAMSQYVSRVGENPSYKICGGVVRAGRSVASIAVTSPYA